MATTRGPRAPERDNDERVDTSFDKRRRPPADASFHTYTDGEGKVILHGRHKKVRFDPNRGVDDEYRSLCLRARPEVA